MLTQKRIQRLINQRHTENLLNLLCESGLALPLPSRIRLLDHPESVYGLGLRRLCELSYDLSPETRELADLLAGTAQWPPESESTCVDPIAQACLAAGLWAAISLPGSDRRWESAFKQQLDHLFSDQDASGWLISDRDHTESDRQLTGCVVYFLLYRALGRGSVLHEAGAKLAAAIHADAHRLSAEAELFWLMSTDPAPKPTDQQAAAPSVLFTAAA